MFKLNSCNRYLLFSKLLGQSLLNRKYVSLYNKRTMFQFSSDKNYHKFIQELKSGRYYQVLGYSSQNESFNVSQNQLKRRYLGMIRKYHSDNFIDPSQKFQNQQITKCIIASYEKVVDQRIKQKINVGVYEDILKDEDQVSMKLFGKKFNQIKYEIFKDENNSKRKQFMQELQKVRKQSKKYQYQYKQKNVYNEKKYYYYQNESTSSSNAAPSSIKLLSGSFVFLIFFGLIYQINRHQKYTEQREQRNKNKLTLSQQKKKQIQRKSLQLYDKKLNNLIQSFTEEQPPSIKLSNLKDPDQLQQLIQLTIAQDIHLFEVPSELLGNKQILQKMKRLKKIEQIKQIKEQFQFKPYELTSLKPNSIISLSLQAQRCLQNIYIKVKDVAEEIQQTGKYTAPLIFFKFYGYIMFQIRPKPLSMLNYRGTQYISLFDLFFDYYSPIPFKRHQFNQYLVGFNGTDQKLFGQVHLNNRKIPQRFISKYDKVVIMKQQISENQQKYQYIWNRFYQKYSKVWTKQTPDRIGTQNSG